MTEYWKHGVEHEGPTIDGWAVYSGCEGDSPTFRAFFPDELDARAFAEAVDPFDRDVDGSKPDIPELLCFDPAVVVAVMTSSGIFTANDYELETHDQLRARINEAEAK